MAKKQHDHLKKKHREKNGNGIHSQLGDILSLTRAFMTGTHGLLAQFAVLPMFWGTFTTILLILLGFQNIMASQPTPL